MRTPPVGQVLVLSASAASKTARQIQWARDAGWVTIAIDCALLIDEVASSSTIERVIDEASRAFRSGNSVVLFTALGPQDPNLA